MTTGAGAGEGAGAGAGAGAAGAGAGAGEGAGAAQSWTAGLTGEIKGYAENKGWKDPAAVVESYQNLERLQGVPADRLLKLPGADGKPEEWTAVYDRLGRPADATGYKFTAPEGHQLDENLAKWAGAAFHEAGLSTKQGEQILSKWNEMIVGQAAETKRKTEADQAAAATALKTEWGAAYEQNATIVDQTAAAMGWGEKEIKALGDALGRAGAMKFIHGISTKIGEHSFHTGDNRPGVGKLTPEQAQSRITELKKDEAWAKRYIAGGATERKELENLMAMAYPGQTL